MIYVETIKIKNNSYPGSHVLEKGFEIKCLDVNLLVGNQGCGKSTLLKLIQKCHSDIYLKMSDYVLSNGVETFFFDSEKDNPRVKDPQLFTHANGQDKGIGYGAALVSRFKSHGEILQDFIITPILKARDCVIILDEPESGLSITNQFRFISAIKIALSNNCQFFIATHCYPLIETFTVISLEHKKRMSGIDFINLIKSDAATLNGL
jgi:predicted ATPase